MRPFTQRKDTCDFKSGTSAKQLIHHVYLPNFSAASRLLATSNKISAAGCSSTACVVRIHIQLSGERDLNAMTQTRLCRAPCSDDSDNDASIGRDQSHRADHVARHRFAHHGLRVRWKRRRIDQRRIKWRRLSRSHRTGVSHIGMGSSRRRVGLLRSLRDTIVGFPRILCIRPVCFFIHAHGHRGRPGGEHDLLLRGEFVQWAREYLLSRINARDRPRAAGGCQHRVPPSTSLTPLPSVC